MLAGDQLGQEALLLLVGAVAADLVDAEVGVRAVGEADGGRGAAHLLDGDDVLEIAQPRAAILLLDGDAVQAELAHLGPQLAREAVGLVDLGGDRRHLVGGETLDLLAQGIGGLAQAEIERRHCVGDHDLLACQRIVVTSASLDLDVDTDQLPFAVGRDEVADRNKPAAARWEGPFTRSLPSSSTLAAGRSRFQGGDDVEVDVLLVELLERRASRSTENCSRNGLDSLAWKTS